MGLFTNAWFVFPMIFGFLGTLMKKRGLLLGYIVFHLLMFLWGIRYVITGYLLENPAGTSPYINKVIEYIANKYCSGQELLRTLSIILQVSMFLGVIFFFIC